MPAWSWSLLLLGLLAVSLLLDGAVPGGSVQLANPDAARSAQMQAAISALPDDALVLVAMDPDLGTYPEIRTAVRSVIEQLRSLDARLAFVSFTPEGRAVASAELARLRAADPDAADGVLDLGFVAGAEAGLVLSVTNLDVPGTNDPLPAAFSAAAGGIAAFDLALVVGGVDIGPRTWVEQVAPRVPSLAMVAVVPTFMHPEVAPYLRTGQLDGLLGTLRDGVAYADASGQGGEAPAGLPMLTGMLVALGVIGRAVWALRRGHSPEPAADEEEAA